MFTSRSFRSSGFDHKFVLRSRRPRSCEVHNLVIYGNDVARICLRFPTLLNFLGFLDILGILVRQVPLNLRLLVFFCRDRFPCTFIPLEHPFAILENSTPRRDWNFFFLHASGFPVPPDPSVPENGLFTDEELATAKFIAVGFDFATILLCSFCSCILFAIVWVQLVKLKY